MKFPRISNRLAVASAAVAISVAQFAWSAWSLHPVLFGLAFVAASIVLALCAPTLLAIVEIVDRNPRQTGNNTVRIRLL